MDREETLNLPLDAANTAVAAEPARLSAMAHEQDESDTRLDELATELGTLTKRQEILLFLATSPHSHYQQEAESNLRSLSDRINAIEEEVREICFLQHN